MPTPRTVLNTPHTVLADGLQLSVTDQGPRATVRYKILWDDLTPFIMELKGTATKSGTTAASIVRTAPHQFPPSPNLCVTSIDSIEPHGRGFPWFGLMARKYALLTVTYSPLQYDFDGSRNGQPYTKISFSNSGEFITFPNTTYRFPDGTSTTTPIGKVISTITINMQRFQLPYLPVAEMAGLNGKVNQDIFTIGNNDFPIGTLLFMGGSSNLEADSLGNLTDEVEYQFIYRSIPWNKFMSPARSGGSTGFQEVTDTGGGKVYELADFSVLP